MKKPYIFPQHLSAQTRSPKRLVRIWGGGQCGTPPAINRVIFNNSSWSTPDDLKLKNVTLNGSCAT